MLPQEKRMVFYSPEMEKLKKNGENVNCERFYCNFLTILISKNLTGNNNVKSDLRVLFHMERIFINRITFKLYQWK
jgi:hypothetical protein